MVYNFRFDRDSRDEILDRLSTQKVLCQGWGGGPDGGLSLQKDDFVDATYKFYDLVSTRIPTNLCRMKEFKDGDLIVTPHLPDHGKVSVHIISGDFPSCYSYSESDGFHLNHQIHLKESYGLKGQISIYNTLLTPWYGKLQWLRLPVLAISEYEDIFSQIVEELRSSATASFSPSEISEYFESVTKRLLDDLKKNLRSMSPSSSNISFERVCEYLITAWGYKIVGRNIYDGQGGDVDLKFVRERSNISPFESGQVMLFVQVKKHDGVTDETAVRQLLNMMKKEPGADGCVMSLADGFTQEAIDLAVKEGILLLDGYAVTRLCLQELGKQISLE